MPQLNEKSWFFNSLIFFFLFLTIIFNNYYQFLSSYIFFKHKFNMFFFISLI